jgi:hypothetical protein
VTGLRVVSHGGGVQTTALLVLAAQGDLDYQTFLFANVGDDSEHPGTLRYLREIAMPYAAAHGITIHELHRVKRDGSIETIYGRMTRPGSRSLPIPVRMGDSGAPGTRTCTSDFKIKVIGRWLKAHGATADDPATIAVGLSVDEIERVNNRRSQDYETLIYPLLGPLAGARPPLTTAEPLRRTDCERVIRAGGLPVPGKSACWFCPFQRPDRWQDMRRRDPQMFASAAQLEAQLIERRTILGRDPVYLTRFGKPLAEAIPAGQLTLDGLDDDPHCDNGWCMT